MPKSDPLASRFLISKILLSKAVAHIPRKNRQESHRFVAPCHSARPGTACWWTFLSKNDTRPDSFHNLHLRCNLVQLVNLVERFSDNNQVVSDHNQSKSFPRYWPGNLQ